MVDGRNDNRALRTDGSYDETRDWFLQNVRMQQALTEKGYELNYSWGIQRHGQKMLRTVFPEMMRWLWRDHGVSTDVHDMVERSFAAPGTREQDPRLLRRVLGEQTVLRWCLHGELLELPSIEPCELPRYPAAVLAKHPLHLQSVNQGPSADIVVRHKVDRIGIAAKMIRARLPLG